MSSMSSMSPVSSVSSMSSMSSMPSMSPHVLYLIHDMSISQPVSQSVSHERRAPRFGPMGA
eukprot:2401801-Lingulodinium_polyedra.AAC.1